MERDRIGGVIREMVVYDAGSPERIQHFLKVFAFASLIAEGEGLDPEASLVLRTAAVVHDIGIRSALEKHGSSQGRLQELEGPPEAERLLRRAGGYTEEQIARVAYLVGHHHTYGGIRDADHRILVEADFLVNLHEGGAGRDAVLAAGRDHFATRTGRWLLETMFGL